MTIDELFIILTMKNPSKYLLSKEEDLFNLIPDLKKCKGFDQKNNWHPYDVYTHILKVVDGVDNSLPIRLAALFHDVGKPHTFRLDENGVGHMRGHWDVSKTIFDDFAIKHNINDNLKELVDKLIYYHDINIGKMSDEELRKLTSLFNEEEIFMLYDLKRADLKAQNSKYHYLIDAYTQQQINLFKFYDEERKKMQDDLRKIILGTSSIKNAQGCNRVLIDNTRDIHIPTYTKLAPKESTIINYNNDLLELSKLKNNPDEYNKYKEQIENDFIRRYYFNRLNHLNIRSLLNKLYDKYGEDIILISHEDIDQISNRRILADYLEYISNIYIPEIIVNKDNNIEKINPIRYKQKVKKVINMNNHKY